MITENLPTLKIHKLTQEQYDRELANGNIDETALYLTPEEEIDFSVYATVEQMNGKANASHTHTIADVTNLQTTLDTMSNTISGKVNSAHTHNVSDITDLTATAKELNYMGGVTSSVQTQLDTLTTTVNGKAASSHTHNNATTSTAGLMSVLDKAKLDSIDEGATNVGLKTNGIIYTNSDGSTKTCGSGEVFNNYPNGNITVNANGYPSQNLASGNYSHAEGYQTTASGYSSHAEGYQTTASGNYSHAEGYQTTASGYYSHAEGYQTTASDYYSHAGGYQTTANAFQQTVGKYNTNYANNNIDANTQSSSNTDALFIVGCGTSSATKNAFRVTTGGKCFGATAFGASGADFAELFEWSDGNIDNEDRRGLFVTLEGEKIRLANANDDYIGIISGAQAFIGNSASEEWNGKYLTDVFGTKLSQEVEVAEEIDITTGNIITPAHTTIQYIVNPDYDPNKEYVMRENRKEWGIVGLLGQIVMIDDGTCTVGSYVKPSINGIGTASDSGYRVMKRVDENHIKVLVR